MDILLIYGLLLQPKLNFIRTNDYQMYIILKAI